MPGPDLDDAVAAFPIVWLQDDRRTVLDVVEPNDGSPIALDVSIPRDALPGRASILVSSAELSVLVGR